MSAWCTGWHKSLIRRKIMFLSRLFGHKTLRWMAMFALVLSLLSINVGAAFASNSEPGAVYVQTNQAAENSIAVFSRSADGVLTLSNTVSTGGLGTGAGLGSQGSVILSNNGRLLFAVNAGSNEISVFSVNSSGLALIDTYTVEKDGLASGPTAHTSSGVTPFGFAFTQQNALIVSEAFGGAALASAVSSYDVSNGGLDVISASVPTGQTAACWIAISKNGKFAYSTNAGSSSVSAYRVGTDGSLSLIDGAAGITGTSGSPIDAGVSNNGQYLYVLNGRTHNLVAFAIQADGTLTSIGTFEGLPAGSAGIAVW